MNINLTCVINETSYGLVSSYILSGLMKRSKNVSLFPIYRVSPAYNKFIEHINKGIENARLFDHNAVSLRIFPQYEMGQHVGKKKIGFPIFELDSLSDIEVHNLKYLDKIIVATKWAKNVIQKYMTVPVGLVPLAYDSDYFYHTKENRKDGPFIFTLVGKFENRKNQKQTIEAFNKAFTGKDDVELHLLCMHVDKNIEKIYGERIIPYIKNCPISYKIKLYPLQFISPIELNKIYNLTDCFILPSHGEGWGLPLMEALACGCHCITTNITGQTEYIDNTIALLLEPIGRECAYDGIYYRENLDWPTFNTDQIVEYMRYAYNNFKGKVNNGGIEKVKTFTWENTISHLEKELTL
jgi:hypothetical protein